MKRLKEDKYIQKDNQPKSLARKSRFGSVLLTLTIASLAILLMAQAPMQSFADVPSPKKQAKIGIDQTEIICKANLVKVYRINADSVDCFTLSTIQKLVDRGMIQDIPKDKLETKKSFRENSPIGTVKKVIAQKQFGEERRLSSELRTVGYLQVFEVCAKDNHIQAPEILITSDSEAKTVKLAQKINAHKCQINSADIKANDPNSIAVSITNKGLITDKLTELDTKIADIQQKLSDKKKDLSEVTKQDSATLGDDAKKTISDTTNEITALRAELNQTKGELNKYLFALHVPSQPKTSDFTKQKLTFTGIPLKDTSVNVLTMTKQISGTKAQSSTFEDLSAYNVVFEACTGKDVLRAPEVRINSDSEEKVIRVSEKIIANSSLMSTAKINAVSADSISLEIANRSDISAKITELEKKIDSLRGEQSKYQTELNDLVVQSEKPDDYEMRVSELSNKIIQLRNEIKDVKSQLYGNIYEVYKNP